MGIFACCSAAPAVADESHPNMKREEAVLNGHGHKERISPNSKLVESLAEAGVRVDARADGGAAQADVVPAVKPADLPAGAPSINERLKQAASVDSTGSSGTFDYLEIINADPVSKEQLNVPLNRVTRYTSQGLACPGHMGAPLPANNDARVATVLSLKQVDTPPSPKIDPILQLATSVLDVDTIMVSLLDGDKKFVKNAAGFVPNGAVIEPPAICHWSLVPQVHQMVVVEDTLLDARTQQNSTVVNPPHLRFYCGAPLVASNGHRLGMLCLVDQKPQKFDTERAAILCNLAELVVRELESTWAAQYQRRHSLKLLRAMDCYKEPYLFVDIASPRWAILHINDAVTQKTGISRAEAASKAFWDLFSIRNSSSQDAWGSLQEDAAEGKSFVIRGARCEAGGAPSERSYNLVFRPATGDAPLDSSLMIGVPAGGLSSPAQSLSYYFVALKSSNTPVANQRPLPFEGLKMGQQLGRGSYGRVYRGTYNGQKIAVKIVEDVSKVQLRDDGQPMESALFEKLSHPGVCKLYAHKMVAAQPRTSADLGAPGAGGGSGTGSLSSTGGSPRAQGNGAEWQHQQVPPQEITELWLLLEYCDKGSVQDAVDKGWFRERPTVDAPPSLPIILTTACEIASAMAFLHGQGIIHGDLTGGNVLLHSNASATHRFGAKVADFGLARDISVVSRLETRTYGTMTHMAPEVLSSDTLSKAADVYSFGVMLWEMVSGQRAWAALNYAQVIHAVAIENRMLQPPEGTSPQVARLMRACMAQDVAKRPPFEQIVRDLERISMDLGASTVSIRDE